MYIRHLLPDIARLPTKDASDPISGIANAGRHIARQQARLNNTVELLGTNQSRPSQYIDPYGVKTWTLPELQFSLAKKYNVNWLASTALWNRRRPVADIAHIHFDAPLAYVAKGRKKIFHAHCPAGEFDTPRKARWLAQYDAVICVSNWMRDNFLKNFDFSPSRTYVVYNGADLEAFATVKPAGIRAKLHLPHDDLLIMYAGALEPEKGLESLIRAIMAISPLYPKVHLVIAGGSSVWLRPGDPMDVMYPFERRMREIAQGFPIHFLGSIAAEAMPSIYHDADIVVCPSLLEEPFGLVVAEGMAAGKPVIGSKRGGIPEIIQDEVTGFIVPSANESALVRALKILLDNPQLRVSMGEAALQRAKLFSWQESAQHIMDIYAEVGALLRPSMP